MAEIFDEINEEIKQEKLENFWKENGTFIIVSVILVISIVGGRAIWSDYKMERDAKRTAAMMQAIESQSVSEYVADSEGNHQMLSNLLAGANAESDLDQRIAYYEAVANNNDYDDMYSDLAGVLAVGLKAEKTDADNAALIAELEPYTGEDRPYRASALELQAFLYAADQKYDQAVAVIDTAIEGDQTNMPPQFVARMETLRAFYHTEQGQ